jgi:hypothetical protein
MKKKIALVYGSDITTTKLGDNNMTEKMTMAQIGPRGGRVKCKKGFAVNTFSLKKAIEKRVSETKKRIKRREKLNATVDFHDCDLFRLIGGKCWICGNVPTKKSEPKSEN